MSAQSAQGLELGDAPGSGTGPTLHTIGYGARTFEQLVAALKAYRIEYLLDVRTSPYSKFKPEFSREPLEAALKPHGIRYVFLGDTLGGQPRDSDCYTDGKVDYEKVRQQPSFQIGLERLRKAHEKNIRAALMCSEGRPEQCHRSKMIGEALAAAGIPLRHMDEDGQLLTQTQVMDRLTGGQSDLFGGPALTLRKPSGPGHDEETEAEVRRDGSVQPTATTDTFSPDLTQARQVLKHTFGFADFYPLQADIVRRVLERRDTLVIMPTGGGKSLCYQLPALLLDGLTVVVSPLIALMQDQVNQLRELGVGAGFLNSSLSPHEHVAVTQRIREGLLRILYVAPETLLRSETLLLMEQCRLACFAVDEAHCISEWGHDFRPEYRQLQQVRQRFPQAACVALTATATPRVREDIRRLLSLPADGEFIASFNRPNLLLAVQPRRDGLGQTLAFLERHRGQAGIIYCSSRKQVDNLAAELQARGWPALPYHAGMDAESRRNNQDKFIRADAAVMVATVAFGMGINKSNVRFVLHYNLPKDIEGYYQEIGRAGRDGLPANCLLFYSRADAITIRRFIDEGAASERAGRSARLDALVRYAEATNCRRGPLLAYFGETHEGACGHCDNCRTGARPVELTDATEAAQKFLSCVKRTGELFGAAHIIDVLRGSSSQRVLQRGHNQLSTYGIGKEFSKEAWRELAQQFIEQGLLEQDLQFGGLRLTAKSQPVLKGEKVFVRHEIVTTPALRDEAVATEHDPELFESLRQLRRKFADQAGMPAYIIFSDRALVEMAAQLPQTAEQFLDINAVGEAKLANYGEAFLKLIRDYCAAHGKTPPGVSAGVTVPAAESTSWLTARRRFEEIGEAFAAGQSLDALAARFDVKRESIVQNLQRYCDAGNRLDAERLLAESKLSPCDHERVLAAFARLGHERLAPVREALGGTVDYDELHLLRLVLKSRK